MANILLLMKSDIVDLLKKCYNETHVAFSSDISIDVAFAPVDVISFIIIILMEYIKKEQSQKSVILVRICQIIYF